MLLALIKIIFMRAIDVQAARTIAAIAETGTFEAAAERLHVTPSAVSQRVRALETDLGRPVLHRTRPVELTEAGLAVLRFARQLELLSADLRAELVPGATGPAPLTIVVNSDSLHTWALPPLAGLVDRVHLEVLREDEAHSLTLLRQGAAAGAVTAEAEPVPGCSVEPLGVMRYLAVCTHGYARRWFPDGVNAASLSEAPNVTYDRKDNLQRRCLQRLTRAPVDPPSHFIPASAEHAEAVRLAMGWGMVPEIECREEVRAGELVHLDERAVVDVPLYWQQWRRSSALLREVGDTLRAAAGRVLRSPAR
jgi:LysR family transcriptional regulator (chromosome initiation inhibitor)